MFCRNCGTELKDDAVFCQNCGIRVIEEQIQVIQPVPETVPQNPGRGFGIAALILGISSLVLSFLFALLTSYEIPLVCGILGIIFGAVGLRKSRKAGMKNTCALVGLILSIAGVSITILFCAFYFIISMLEGISTSSTNPSI